MKLLRLFLILNVCLMVFSCSLHSNPSGVKVKSSSVKVDVNSNGNSGFCPPGQRKKGNC